MLEVYDFGLGCADETLAVDGQCITVGVSYELPSCAGDEIVYPGLAHCEPLDDDCPADDDPLTFSADYPGALFVWTGAEQGGDGSAAAPFQTIQKAINIAAGNGARIVVAPGNYDETVAIEAGPIIVEGVCARDVTVQTTSTGATAIEITPEDKAEDSITRVARMTILSEGVGIRATSTSGHDIEIESVIIESEQNAIVVKSAAPDGFGLADNNVKATVNRALLSTIGGSAIVATGYNLEVTNTRISKTAAALDSQGDLGAGIWARPMGFVPIEDLNTVLASPGSYLVVSNTLIEGAQYAGVLSEGSIVQLSKSVVRHISPVGAAIGWDDSGAGVSIAWHPWRDTDLPTGQSPRSSLAEVLIHDVANVGLRVQGVDLDVSQSTIRAVGAVAGLAWVMASEP